MSLPAHVAPLLDQLDAASDRLVATVERLPAEDVAGPSALPGWRRAHVLTHLARNGDAFTRMVEGAARGELVQQYAGGREQRQREIEAGVQRPAADILADVPRSCRELARAWRAMPDDAWNNLIGRTNGPAEAWRGLQARLLEVEVHHADLAAGYGWRDWPAAFADAVLDQAATRVARAAAEADHGQWRVARTDGPGEWPLGGGQQAGRVSGPGTALLAWLLGRSDARDAGLAIDGDWSAGADLPKRYPYG
jgi:maleylpyruvate isomerase